MSHTRINHFNVNGLVVARKGSLPSGSLTTDLKISDEDGNDLVITLFHDEELIIQITDERN